MSAKAATTQQISARVPFADLLEDRTALLDCLGAAFEVDDVDPAVRASIVDLNARLDSLEAEIEARHDGEWTRQGLRGVERHLGSGS